MAGMAPGDMLTRAITVTNNGTLAQRYAVVSVTTEDTLAPQLALTIKSGVTSCTDGGFAGTGVVAYGPNKLGSTTPGTKLIGDSATGPNGGTAPWPPQAPRRCALFLRTKGDANDTPDPNLVPASAVTGVMTGSVPYLGSWLVFYQSRLGKVLTLGTPLLLIFIAQVISMSGDWRDAGRARTQAGGDDPNSDDPNSDDPPYAEGTINP
jgi:hypothetical protein